MAPPPSSGRPMGRPPPPRGPPPPPPPRQLAGSKRPAGPPPSDREKMSRTSITIRPPVAMRDVTAFDKKHQVGEGTYGSVFLGKDKKTGEMVALKRINTKQEENGFPITAIREVKILKALNHVNIVDLKEIVTSKDHSAIPKNVYMVFEYLEYDLTGILEAPEIRLNQDHIKSWAQQLLNGVHYMHTNKVIHRDLKASNILVNRQGQLKIADWGLARSWNSEMKRLTNRVITLWYRPTELLLGCVEYTPKIDMWSVGVILAEMFRRTGFIKGTNEASQLNLIFQIAGHPNEEDWPNIHKMCPLWKNYEPRLGETPLPRRVREELKNRLQHPSWMTEHAMDLIDNLLAHNPDKRWSADQGLTAEYFFENPIVKPADKLNMRLGLDSIHELDVRKKHDKLMAARKERAQAAANRRSGAKPAGRRNPPPPSGPPPR
eukprot:CAMPEP_0185726346 /NCGR_PEP_ID=MMETSP1171-20130828/2348_1 /TAXON_ID=374046 /ORGANISM="Helicotheca tamensis, Strain CCMP826" /LENGTH=432 /DNA_ID=CAMNT_0028394677 /DNA_START=413 /DNA_END=1711 /DNA_ORIENTATION=+